MKKSCRCGSFFVSLYVKTKFKKTRTSTQRKDTSKYSNKQLFRKINASIKDKCTTSGIELTDFIQTGSGIVLHAITKNKSPCCPYCGAPSHSMHDYRYRKLQCTEMLSQDTEIIIVSRRMNCTNDKCPKKTFMEPLKFARPYSRRTDEVALRIKEESLNQPSRLASETLARQHIKVSSSTCLRKARFLGKENPEDITCSGYVAIDDLAYRKGHRYMCAIADHYTRKVLAVFDTRYGPEIGEWFKKHPEIKLVSRDGSWAYASIIKGALPNAKQVSDHFHLDKRLGDNMVEVIQKMICQTDDTLPYPCPLEGEAKSYIMEDIYDIGDAKHRKMVCNYYAARHTTSEKLFRLKQTQPNIDKILQTCISFRRMIAGKENAPDIDAKLTKNPLFLRFDAKVVFIICIDLAFSGTFTSGI